jgi:hypothetical protein
MPNTWVIDAPPLDEKSLRGNRLYGVAFSEGTVKVGRSTSVTKRLAQHISSAAGFGHTIDGYWVSREVDGNLALLEASLLGRVGAEATGRRRFEYFVGVPLERTAEIASGLLGEAVEVDAGEPTDIAVGIRIGELIQKSGFSVATVAEMVGVGKTNLYRKIRGENRLTFVEAVRIARILDVPVDSIAKAVK